MRNLSDLARELRRRHVFRVAAGYAFVGWIVIEAASVLVPQLMLPEWLARAVTVLVLLGFPIALVLAWAYDITPDGIRTTDGAGSGDSPGDPPGDSPDTPERRPAPTGTASGVRRRALFATELRMGLDYLETRDDVDMDALAYVGLSWGAGSRLGFAAVDDRFRAVIFVGGGIDERVQPTLPEASNVNFAPRIEAPTLLLNGREDEEHPWLTRALPLWNLLSEPKELVLVEGAGHVPPPEARVPAMLDFLDRHLGPARR